MMPSSTAYKLGRPAPLRSLCSVLLYCVHACGVRDDSGFKHRPKVFTAAEEVNARSGIRKRAEELEAIGMKLGRNMLVRSHCQFHRRELQVCCASCLP